MEGRRTGSFVAEIDPVGAPRGVDGGLPADASTWPKVFEGNPMAPPDAGRQAATTPDAVLEMLREGNKRFVDGTPLTRNTVTDIQATSGGQHPLAVVLGCIDSRVPPETVLDCGIGDVFAARVAGNIVDEDLLGSMEFACKLAGAKAILVMGHTACGAIKGAVSKARLGNLSALLQKIEPACDEVREMYGPAASDDMHFVDACARHNVTRTVNSIRSQSEVLRTMEKEGKIKLAGSMYDVSTGVVTFL